MKEITGFDEKDIAENKIIAALAYILFLIPLLAAPKSKFAKFHTNQGLWLNIVEFAGWVILPRLPLFGGLLYLAFSLATFVATVYLIYVTYTGKAYELPVVGSAILIK